MPSIMINPSNENFTYVPNQQSLKQSFGIKKAKQNLETFLLTSQFQSSFLFICSGEELRAYTKKINGIIQAVPLIFIIFNYTKSNKTVPIIPKLGSQPIFSMRIVSCFLSNAQEQDKKRLKCSKDTPTTLIYSTLSSYPSNPFSRNKICLKLGKKGETLTQPGMNSIKQI